jgi:hypothetical protein
MRVNNQSRFHRRFIWNCLMSLLFIGPLVVDVEAATYYVDSAGGNDGNSGTATNAAWQTLTKVNGTTFSAGDNILFRTGGSWTGTLSPLGSGATNNPIIISSYGTNPAMPLINGNGNVAAVALTNQPYWEIDNLEIINPAATEAERYGIHLTAANFGTVNHLYVSNCYVHNICGLVDTNDGDLEAKRTGGITIEVLNDATNATRFNDISIQNCTVSSVTNQGIVACGNRSGGSDYPGTTNWNARYCSNLIIRNNVINGVCKNAMSIRYGDNTCLVENNVVFNTAITTSGNQIAAYGCWGTVFQYNEGYGNQGGNNAEDGSLYDSDLRCVQTVWQYSYSHDEFFGLFVQYAASSSDDGGIPGGDTNDVVRYNISRNDHGNGSDKGAIFTLTGDSTAISSEFIYNNTIYTPANLSPDFVYDQTSGHTTTFYNNIFYNLSSTAIYNFTSGNSNLFDYNVFYDPNGKPDSEPTDANELTNDPELVAPGTGTNGLNTVSGYKLQSGSPCIDSGLTITTNLTGNPNAGGLDFWGNIVPFNGVTDRGANEWSGSAPIVSTQPATGLTGGGATLNASVNPGGEPTAYYFQFGTITNYGSITSTNDLPAGTNLVTGSDSISGLLPGTLYHYKVVATNSTGTGSGADATFTTVAISQVQLSSPALLGSLAFNFSFTNTSGVSFTVYTTTNLTLTTSNWTFLGYMTESPSGSGQYQFTDPQATNSAQRFYQVRWQ